MDATFYYGEQIANKLKEIISHLPNISLPQKGRTIIECGEDGKLQRVIFAEHPRSKNDIVCDLYGIHLFEGAKMLETLYIYNGFNDICPINNYR